MRGLNQLVPNGCFRCFWLVETDYLIHKDEQMSLTSINKLDKALDRMITGEPIQYIVGFQSFMVINIK